MGLGGFIGAVVNPFDAAASALTGGLYQGTGSLTGGAAGMGPGNIVGGLTGQTQADAALRAAQLQYQASQEAMKQQREMFDILNQQQAPYRQAGYTSLNALNSLLGLPPAYTTQPYYGPYAAGVTPGQGQTNVQNAPGAAAPSRADRLAAAAPFMGGSPSAQQALQGLSAVEGLRRVGPASGRDLLGRAATGAATQAVNAPMAGGPAYDPRGGVFGPGGMVSPGGMAQPSLIGPYGTPGAPGAPARPEITGPVMAGGGVRSLGPVAPGYQPQAGGPGFGSLTRMFGPEDLQSNLAPNYQFMLQQGLGATRQGQNVTGGGSNMQRAATKFAEDYASNAYQNALQNYTAQQQNIYNRLSGIAGIGQTAQNQQNQMGGNLANALSQMGVGGASALGAGQVGAANAQAGALQNLLGLGTLAMLI